jgi:hypothetical protein
MSHWYRLLAKKIAITAADLTVGIKQNINLKTEVAIEH